LRIMRKQARPINTNGPDKLTNRIAFIVGWLLSPFSFWNDAFINIPISYLSANLIIKFVRVDFLMAMLVSYWISNILGIAIMYFSGRQIIKTRKDLIREIIIFALTIVIYSEIIVVINKFGILKPVW
jgi:hypothetical protein